MSISSYVLWCLDTQHKARAHGMCLNRLVLSTENPHGLIELSYPQPRWIPSLGKTAERHLRSGKPHDLFFWRGLTPTISHKRTPNPLTPMPPQMPSDMTVPLALSRSAGSGTGSASCTPAPPTPHPAPTGIWYSGFAGWWRPRPHNWPPDVLNCVVPCFRVLMHFSIDNTIVPLENRIGSKGNCHCSRPTACVHQMLLAIRNVHQMLFEMPCFGKAFRRAAGSSYTPGF